MDPEFFIQLIVNGIVRGSMYGLMGMGLALVFGVMGIINFAYGEFFMIGAYIGYWILVILGFPPYVGLVASFIALFAFGLAVERSLLVPLRRRLGKEWLEDGPIITIGLLVVFQNLATITFGGKQHGTPTLVEGRLSIGEVFVTYERLTILGAAIACMASLGAFLRFTNFGLAIRATAQIPEAAQTLGINIRTVYALTFAISTGLVGAVGAVLIPIYPAYPTVGGEILIKSFWVVIIGGLGSVWGAVVAGLMVGVVEAFAAAFASGGWQTTITAGMVLAVLVFRPTGLFGKRATRP